MATRKSAVTLGDGKTMPERMEEMVAFFERSAKPMHVEDAMTKLGYTDRFERELIKRAFMASLKPGAENEHLTKQKKWLRGREKWAADLVDAGKPLTTFDQTTRATDRLMERVEKLNGDLAENVHAAVSNITATMASRAGKKFDSSSVTLISEDIDILVSENAALNRENKLHERYRKQNEEQMAIMKGLVARLQNGTNVPA